MKQRLFAAFLTVMMLLTLTACGGSAAKSEEAEGDWAVADLAVEESASPSAAPMEMGYLEDTIYEETESKVEAPAENPSATGQKLIRTAWLELESTEFDEAALGLKELTAQYGGYFETSSVANYKKGARWGEYTVRVPAEVFDAFLSHAGALCHLTWQEVSQEDISEAYYDTAGRLKTQQIKLERLQNLLSEAEDMEDIIALESAISETEWQIENLSGTLRRYDGKVNYATVHVNLREVYKLSSVEEVPDTFGQRMGNAFAEGLRNCGDLLENLAVGFAYSWMWWLLAGGAVVAVVRVLRKKIGQKWTLCKKKGDKQDEL